MADKLVVPVEDLVGSVGYDRAVVGDRPVKLRLGESIIDGPMHVEGKVVGTTDGVNAKFDATADVHLVCTRCLEEWSEPLSVSGSQHFRREPDDDGYAIEGGAIDIGAPATDELALAIPAAPLCRADCRGLCPTCGTDLNRDPCDGHGDDSDSPFSVLKDLFES